jgi:hypothetical protein
MARIPVSGINDQAMQIFSSGAREVVSGLNPDGDGRIFYLTHISITNEHATEGTIVELWDIDEAAPSADDTTHRGSTIQIGPNTTTHVDYVDGSMPFVTNCVASLSAATGTVAIGGIHAAGYLA